MYIILDYPESFKNEFDRLYVDSSSVLSHIARTWGEVWVWCAVCAENVCLYVHTVLCCVVSQCHYHSHRLLIFDFHVSQSYRISCDGSWHIHNSCVGAIGIDLINFAAFKWLMINTWVEFKWNRLSWGWFISSEEVPRVSLSI